jgi:DNA polymerase III psi subunit
MKVTKHTWKDKRIEVINKLSKEKGWRSSPNNPYFEEVQAIYEATESSLRKFKKNFEIKKFLEHVNSL